MRRIILFVLACSCPVALSVVYPRTWTDKTGQHQVEAEYLMSHGDKVWVRRSDGEAFEVALSDLSEADQKYVRQRAREQEAKQAARPADPQTISYGRPRQLAELANRAIDESSGLACSRARPGLFWTHNDSGDYPRIYLFDAKGQDLGSCDLTDAPAYDWEDMASFTHQGKHYLLLGDVGNNGLSAGVQSLHLIEEPPLDPSHGPTVRQVPVLRTVYFAYEDQPRNCEALAVDPTDRTVLLATKQLDLKSYVYALPWPKDEPKKNGATENKESTPKKKAVVARRIATVNVPLVTAMDVSPDGRRAVLLTYGNAYEFVRRAHEDWPAAFAREPRPIQMPLRVQGESICYGSDGKSLYLTSEKLPTPFWEVPAE